MPEKGTKHQKHTDTQGIPKLEGWMTFPEAAAFVGLTKQGFHKAVFDHPGTFKTVHALGEKPIYVVQTEEVKAYKTWRDELLAMRAQMKAEREQDDRASNPPLTNDNN